MKPKRLATPVLSFCFAIFVAPLAFGQAEKAWTTTQDFSDGELINLNASTVADQLQINTWSETETADPAVLPYIWVACSGHSTVVRIATSTFDPLAQQTVSVGQILGRYYTAPSGCRETQNPGGGPSRTTVDFDGSVWVANRNNVNSPSAGHVVKIGNGLAFQWIDRDNDGILDTSTGPEYEPLPRNNPDGNCDASDVSGADDELILLYRPVPATGTRTIAVDRENNVWVGGSQGTRRHGLIDGQTGEDIEGFEFYATTCGGYGGLVDCDGVLWSAYGALGSGLLRLDPNPGGLPVETCITVNQSYGLGVDTLGNIWNTRWFWNSVMQLDPLGNILHDYATGGRDSRGITVTPADNTVWIANSDTDTVTRLRNSDGEPLGDPISTGVEPTGVAVDSDGHVWVTNLQSHTVQRINKETKLVDQTVPLGVGCFPYNYSDMTGVSLYHTTSPAGVWADVYDSGANDTVWGTATWTQTLGHANSTVRVSVRASNIQTDLGKEIYRNVENGVLFTCDLCDLQNPFECGGIIGRYVQLRVQLNAYCHEQNRPTLQSLSIQADDTT